MARKVKTVKIELDDGSTKDFTIKELSIQDILDLSQQNAFFTQSATPDAKKSQNGEDPADTEAEKGLMEDLTQYGATISEIMAKICDFQLVDLKPLAPSDVAELYDGFKEVNATFLGVLEKLKIPEMVSKTIQKHMSNFSKMLAIL